MRGADKLAKPEAEGRPEKPTAIVNVVFPDGTSGDFFEGWETWQEFLERKFPPPTESP